MKVKKLFIRGSMGGDLLTLTCYYFIFFLIIIKNCIWNFLLFFKNYFITEKQVKSNIFSYFLVFDNKK